MRKGEEGAEAKIPSEGGGKKMLSLHPP